jgi:hypothetical protein
MAITVAPLTTAVLNAVPAHRTGVASGINNAVASVGSLLLIAILGTLALGVFDRSLDHQLAYTDASPAVRLAVQSARGGLVMPSLSADLPTQERKLAHAIIADSLIHTVRLALWVAAGLALAAALAAALTLPRRDLRQRISIRAG